ncbi:EPIDERMAL PATTERNING FACTOR-like protein 5 [Physcomitrium patens]|uniref:Epidermal patterning factor-like protein n=1 Tax=Physcomitrium patens TaxID=3218 RepID=A0A2K1IIX3_PHYPA|nr:EPIDERMAL PATTERNING FACTOR-like protein 5 [Physcomitrium patens]PNR29231.1 hypothetical protein PHYPA_027923 [Physcomitrium patens]|eukprot:XP_024362084.1 EPIDERMAL PATTERNING FACTOR-like protein 5 [Physcomitrella patens]
MTPAMVDFWMGSLAILILLPTSAFARVGPAGVTDPPVETISYLERTLASPSADVEKTSRGIEVPSLDRRGAPRQEEDTIFGHFQIKEFGGGISRRRGLVGSSPPTCRFQCGTCTPCKPVHVAIGSPHSMISQTEYYPEVWRCQCGDRYYIP